MIKKIFKINKALALKFGKENSFKIMTRLIEECGELAEQVNNFENSGIKRIKLGKPNKTKLAKEVQDVIRCALQIADYYKIRKQLNKSVDSSYKELNQKI